MTNPPSFFNWSLRKALDTEPDSFIQARIRIVFIILLFAVLKAAIALATCAASAQWMQLYRAAVALPVYLVLAKVLLYRPDKLRQIAHIMLSLGVMLVWTNIFFYVHKINLPALQFVFMMVLGGFYTLGIRQGFFYSVMGISPIVLSIILQGSMPVYFNSASQEIASPGFEVIVVLNFISIVLAHYYFYKAFSTNIREKEKLNRQLQASVAEARALAESKTNFLSTMSHELRTPLNSVIGTTELLLDEKPEERQKENLKILQQSAHDLLALINNILDFNKIDSDKLKLEATPFRLSNFIRDTCAALRLKAKEKLLDFKVDIDDQLQDIEVVSDPTRLSQLIYNLVGNAIKFTEEGSVSVKLECKARAQGQVTVQFTISDTGIGIHPDKHDAIFELFTQAESYTTRKYGGTGLGLAIVKQVLSLFNSTLHLESSPWQGAKFFFDIQFPIVEATAVSKPARVNDADFSDLKILIAEDNDVNRLLLKKQMDKLKISAVVVENGKQAIEAVLEADYDAIFMDLHMPVADGYEATKAIRQLSNRDKANAYIVAFTASVTEQQKIFDAGFNDFLYKPVNMADLSDKLQKIASRERVKSHTGYL